MRILCPETMNEAFLGPWSYLWTSASTSLNPSEDEEFQKVGIHSKVTQLVPHYSKDVSELQTYHTILHRCSLQLPWHSGATNASSLFCFQIHNSYLIAVPQFDNDTDKFLLIKF